MKDIISKVPRWLYIISFGGLGLTNVLIGNSIKSQYSDSFIGGALSIYLTGGWMIAISIGSIINKNNRLLYLLTFPMMLISTVWILVSPFIASNASATITGWLFFSLSIVAYTIQIVIRLQKKEEPKRIK